MTWVQSPSKLAQSLQVPAVRSWPRPPCLGVLLLYVKPSMPAPRSPSGTTPSSSPARTAWVRALWAKDLAGSPPPWSSLSRPSPGWVWFGLEPKFISDQEQVPVSWDLRAVPSGDLRHNTQHRVVGAQGGPSEQGPCGNAAGLTASLTVPPPAPGTGITAPRTVSKFHFLVKEDAVAACWF